MPRHARASLGEWPGEASSEPPVFRCAAGAPTEPNPCEAHTAQQRNRKRSGDPSLGRPLQEHSCRRPLAQTHLLRRQAACLSVYIGVCLQLSADQNANRSRSCPKPRPACFRPFGDFFGDRFPLGEVGELAPLFGELFGDAMSMSDRQLRQIRPRVQPQADPKNTSSGALELWSSGLGYGLRCLLPMRAGRRRDTSTWDPSGF